MKPSVSRWFNLVATAIVAVAPTAGLAVERPTVAGAPSGGRVSIEQEVIDLGEVVRGATATATFVLRNTGEETLHVFSAKPG